jgi:hypothetical protein
VRVLAQSPDESDDGWHNEPEDQDSATVVEGRGEYSDAAAVVGEDRATHGVPRLAIVNSRFDEATSQRSQYRLSPPPSSHRHPRSYSTNEWFADRGLELIPRPQLTSNAEAPNRGVHRIPIINRSLQVGSQVRRGC